MFYLYYAANPRVKKLPNIQSNISIGKPKNKNSTTITSSTSPTSSSVCFNQCLGGFGNFLGFLDRLSKRYVYDQPSQFCANKVPEEGIVIRTEGRRVEALKLKAWAFLEYEGKELDKGEANIEDETEETQEVTKTT